MNNLRISMMALLVSAAGSAFAQNLVWNREQFPDLPDPNPKTVDLKTHRQMVRRIEAQRAEGRVRPDHVNNALNPSFPPVINQSGGSCGAACSIWYQFTNQINTARFTAADDDSRRYPTHFFWLLTGDGLEYTDMGLHVGTPSAATYGGRTYSELFGVQDNETNNYGWMQGYDKWYSAMFNRLLRQNNFAIDCGSEEGREVVKNYLWNRCGDDSYASGGVCGIGVAAGPFSDVLPKTEANDAAGVTGLKYITDWNVNYNHAVTICGYDDRIEFDLDGNGIPGEVDKDERGAWIICNSWSDKWENNGFIYCPYAKSNSVKGWTTYWKPGYFDVIRDYRPLRTMRIKMEYSHRSEMALYIGVAQDTTATKPEKYTALRHFEYCGDNNRGRTQPAPAVPMLGKWADGMHYEPMEFGYDLTMLTEDFDLSRPLKYFFWVETRAWGEGSGKIHELSVIDYTLDREGVVTPFYIPEPVDVPSAGAKTELTAVVRGESVPEPRNLSISGQTLAWQAPVGSLYRVGTYRVYRDGELLTTVDGTTLQTTIDGAGGYTVSAVYPINGHDVESRVSATVAPAVEPMATVANDIIEMKNGAQITIPAVCSNAITDFTLEFWLRPRTFSGESFGIKAMNGESGATFFFKVNSNKFIEIGHDGGDYTTSGKMIKTATAQHIAIVCEGQQTRVYVNGEVYVNWTSNYGHSGIESAADLVLGLTEGISGSGRYKEIYTAGWAGYVDEIRFWDYARSISEIRTFGGDVAAQPSLYPHLTHCYHMDTRTDEDGNLYLIDAKGGHDALVTGASYVKLSTVTPDKSTFLVDTAAVADFRLPASIVAGKPVSLTDLSSLSTVSRQWQATGAETASLRDIPAPVLVFNQAGTQTVTLTTTNLFGHTAEKTAEIQVLPATIAKVDFRLPEVVTAGEHVTFINTSDPVDAATYEWYIEGAEQPVVKTVNAAASFTSYGTYTVRLTAHTPSGTQSTEKLVRVEKIAPVAAFLLDHNVLLRGEKAYLVDQSRYDPDELRWQVSSNFLSYIVRGGNTSVTFDEPGVYDVRLTASNDRGAHSVVRNRGIVVCNADGDRGLFFDNADNCVTAASPFGEESPAEFTVEWWMYPGRLLNRGNRIGDAASTFMLQTMADGTMQCLVGGKTVSSLTGYVVADEWHHYAVTFKAGTVTFYRDGVKNASRTSGVAALPILSRFELGGPVAPMHAIVDELRVWGRVLTEDDIFADSNAPLTDPEARTDLRLYYDFNQHTGDVIDLSAQHLTGQRTGFGPDGDAWTETFGIFFLNPKADGTDVTATYMKNYRHPFTTSAGYVNGNSRFERLAMNTTRSPWKQENSVLENNIATQFYVDAAKAYFLCLQTTWSGFATSVKNLKLYQTVTLPAGAYQFSANAEGREWENEGTYNVVAKGAGLPDTDAFSTALDYGLAGEKCTFILDEETEVSLGCVSNMSGQKCLAIGNFSLVQKNVVITDANGDVPTDVEDVPVSVQPSMEVQGGLGCITVRVSEPQHVTIADLAGKVLFHERVESVSRIPAPRGIYVVNHRKVMVR